MNQKQRDLLCKMLLEKAAKIQNSLSKLFPLVRQRGESITYRYDRLRIDGDRVSALPPELRQRYKSLKKQSDKLKNENEKLDALWNIWSEKVEYCGEESGNHKNAALTKLKHAVNQAIIDIQFAEDASQAKEILSSLPTASQLM